MDDNIEDTRIVYIWKIHSSYNRLTRQNEIPRLNFRDFPQSGKYANKFRLTFDLKNIHYSYYLSASSLNIQGKMDVCLFMLENNDENSLKRINERKLTCICNGNYLDEVGFPDFCLNEVLNWPDFNAVYLTLGCEIIFCEQLIYSPITRSLLHYRSMQNQFKQLLENDELSDFTIVVDAQEIKVHKAILAARSPVFKTMLTIDMAEKKSNRLEIKDIDLKIVKAMIEFMYTNKIDDELDPNEAEQLLIVADEYLLENLKDLCTDLIERSLNIDNITQHMLLAARYKRRSLMDAVKKLMKCYSVAIDIACDGMLEQPSMERLLNIENITQHMLLAAEYKNKDLMDAVEKLMKNNPNAIDIASDEVLEQLSMEKSLNIKNIIQYMLLAVRYKSKSLMDAVKKLMKSDSKAVDIACDGMLEHF